MLATSIDHLVIRKNIRLENSETASAFSFKRQPKGIKESGLPESEESKNGVSEISETQKIQGAERLI